jgi:hypothetical protein
MRHLFRTLVSLVCIGIGTAQAQSLFEDARAATPQLFGQRDHTGVTLRGGVDLHTYLSPQTTTLFRTDTRIGGTCGAFDFGASVQQAFEEIPALVEVLG